MCLCVLYLKFQHPDSGKESEHSIKEVKEVSSLIKVEHGNTVVHRKSSAYNIESTDADRQNFNFV